MDGGVNLKKKSDEDKIVISRAESCTHVLRGLISYHERMTMGEVPEKDFYLDALRFALACVEEKAGQ